MPRAESPDIVMMDRMTGNTRAIEDSEARGQQKLINSTHLPLQMNPSREAYEALGFRFGEPTDKLFIEAALPEGWTKRTDPGHSMWSHVFDEQGRKRVGVFYKAAFYDRSAHMSLVARFRIKHKTEDYQGPRIVVDNASGETLFEFEHNPMEGMGPGMRWLDEHRPGWKSDHAFDA